MLGVPTITRVERIESVPFSVPTSATPKICGVAKA
jgi:hypothetical protein